MLIYKQELPMDTLDILKLKLPFDSAKEAKEHIFKVDLQYDVPCMWYQADLHKNENDKEDDKENNKDEEDNNDNNDKEFCIVAIGTGHPWDDRLSKDNYIGTAMLMGGMLVLHYFIIEAEKMFDYSIFM